MLALALAASALAGLLALPAAMPAARAARVGRSALRVGFLLWALLPLFHPATGNALHELGPILASAGLPGLASTGVADAILDIRDERRRQAGERIERTPIGFLQRYREDAVYDRDRHR